MGQMRLSPHSNVAARVSSYGSTSNGADNLRLPLVCERHRDRSRRAKGYEAVKEALNDHEAAKTLERSLKDSCEYPSKNRHTTSCS